MKIYVATYGSGGVLAAGADEAAVKESAERRFRGSASEIEWRPDGGGLDRMYYRMTDTGRWNKIPATYIQSVEIEL